MSPRLRLGWWNTSLSPPISEPSTPSLNRRLLAREVIRHLLFEEVPKCEIVALGEITASELDSLLAPMPEQRHFGRLLDDARNMAVLYDTRIVDRRSEAKLIAFDVKQEVHAGFLTVFEAQGSLLHIIVSHWPSRYRFQDKHRAQRIECGRHIRDAWREIKLKYENPALIVIGDFNDEPFDESLTSALPGTRDRALVRDNDFHLYNPFWRKLGEHLALEEDVPFHGAGSHRSTLLAFTSWATIDQALLSSSLLRNDGWTLVEAHTNILPLQMLLTEAGRFRLGFDHFPIRVSLEYQAK